MNFMLIYQQTLPSLRISLPLIKQLSRRSLVLRGEVFACLPPAELCAIIVCGNHSNNAVVTNKRFWKLIKVVKPSKNS